MTKLFNFPKFHYLREIVDLDWGKLDGRSTGMMPMASAPIQDSSHVADMGYTGGGMDR
jgi:hypothetical protein